MRSVDADTGQASEDSTVGPDEWLSVHGDVLFHYALARVRHEETAEDLVQDTLLAAISSRHAFRGASSERTWLIGIMRHKILDYFRGLAREQKLWADPPNEGAIDADFDEEGRWAASVGAWQSPEKSLEQREFWTVFVDCAGRLPEALRAPFALRELDGINTDELAAILRTTRNNVWVMLSRARQQLRKCLEINWFGRA
jgi:RNA polymerase sigma-70 factor (ECF subfamily)